MLTSQAADFCHRLSRAHQYVTAHYMFVSLLASSEGYTEPSIR